MANSKTKRKRATKSILKLPDLEQSKSPVLNSLTSSSSQQTYDHAIREFIEWYCSEPRLAFLLGHALCADNGAVFGLQTAFPQRGQRSNRAGTG